VGQQNLIVIALMIRLTYYAILMHASATLTILKSQKIYIWWKTVTLVTQSQSAQAQMQSVKLHLGEGG